MEADRRQLPLQSAARIYGDGNDKIIRCEETRTGGAPGAATGAARNLQRRAGPRLAEDEIRQPGKTGEN